eukprot:18823-Eustigmatos_ZCMA.PRE.1
MESPRQRSLKVAFNESLDRAHWTVTAWGLPLAEAKAGCLLITNLQSWSRWLSCGSTWVQIPGTASYKTLKQ